VNERDQTSVDYIYAIGSVQHGRLSTTGLSVHAGKLLARRLYGEDSILVHSLYRVCTIFMYNLYIIIDLSRGGSYSEVREMDNKLYVFEFM